MTRRIAIASQKGGCGKTTVALNLALAFAERGQRTLLIDVDPQGGIGHSLGKGDAELVGLVDVLMGSTGAQEAVIKTHQGNLSILPRGRLDAVDAVEFERAILEPGVLVRVIEQVEDDFDVILLDTPSGVGLPTRATLSCCHFVIVPVQGEPLALRTITQVLRVIEHVKSHENDQLQLLGILPTMVDRSKEPSLNVLVAAWRELAGVLETVVPRADVFTAASETGLPLAYLGGPVSPEARRFEMLAGEVNARMEELAPKEEAHDRPQRALL